MKKISFLLFCLGAATSLTGSAQVALPSPGYYYRIVQLPESNNTVLGANGTQPVVQILADTLSQAFRFAPVYGKPDTYHLINGKGEYLNKSTASSWNTLFQNEANGENAQWLFDMAATCFRLKLLINSGYLASDNTADNSPLYCDKSSSHTNGRFVLQELTISPAQWLQILDRTILEALADTVAIHNATGNPGYNNLHQYRTALANAGDLPDNTPATLETAITSLTLAIDEYDALIAAYAPLKAAITGFTAALTASEYPAKQEFETALAQAQAIYGSQEDQRAQITAVIEILTAKSEILSRYERLKNEIAKANKTVNTTGYPDKAGLQTAIATAEDIYADPQGKDLLTAINDLNTALAAYINGRPSNWATIRNGALWMDNNNNSVQAHGAGFLQMGDVWYMVGEDRTAWNSGVNLYSSTDFVSWKFERKIIPPSAYSSSRFIERPKLLYCAATGKYVVWCHYEGDSYAASEAASFVCDSVNGLYTMMFNGRPLDIKSRDCNVFVDDDGKAYFVSTTDENQNLTLFELSDDYLYPVQSFRLTAFNGKQREAPAIVRIGDTCFLISSLCTGWEPNQATVSYSKSLTSGWTSQTNIGNKITFDTQAASVLTVRGREDTSYIYVGDRWQDPELAESKTIMFPIQFNGNTCTFNYRQSFDLDMATGKWRETDNSARFVPKTNWTVHSFSSQETAGENSPATNVIDGNTNTHWHTKYSSPAATAPHSIAVDMGEACEISGFLCTARMDGETNGLIREFVFSVSNDGIRWETVAGGAWLPYSSEVYFTPVVARYFRLESLSGNYASIAELDIIQGNTGKSPAAIAARYKVGASGNWQTGSDITLTQASALTFSPTAGTGTWAWTLPRNKTLTGRELTISSVVPTDSGIYTACYLNPYSVSAKKDFNLTVNKSKIVANRKLNSAIMQAQAVYGDRLNGATALQTAIDEAHALAANSASVEQKDSMTAVLLEKTAACIALNAPSGTDKTDAMATPGNFTSKTPEGWTGTMPTATGSGCAAFQDTTFVFSQTIENLDNGHYLLGVQALYRSGDNDGGIGYENSTEQQQATFFAGNKSIFVQSLYSLQYPESNALNGFANTMSAVDYLFDQSETNYANWLLVTVENNTLDAGLHKTASMANDWCVFNNFRLIYLDAPSAINSVTPKKLVTVYGQQNGIKITAPERSAVTICSITGQLIHAGEISGTEFIPLPKGVYIVNQNKTAVR
jgi:hypothetical protein